MSIKIEKTENANELKLSFEIEAKKFDEAINKVYVKSAKYFKQYTLVYRSLKDKVLYCKL